MALTDEPPPRMAAWPTAGARPFKCFCGTGVVHFHNVAALDALHPGCRHGEVECRQPGRFGRTALQHQNAGPFSLTKPPCGNAGRRTPANDDIVKGRLHFAMASPAASKRCMRPASGFSQSCHRLCREITGCTHHQAGRRTCIDMQEGVRAQMFGQQDCQRPTCLCLRTMSICSGRMPTVCALCLAASAPSMKFIFGEPMKPATNSDFGLL